MYDTGICWTVTSLRIRFKNPFLFLDMHTNSTGMTGTVPTIVAMYNIPKRYMQIYRRWIRLFKIWIKYSTILNYWLDLILNNKQNKKMFCHHVFIYAYNKIYCYIQQILIFIIWYITKHLDGVYDQPNKNVFGHS